MALLKDLDAFDSIAKKGDWCFPNADNSLICIKWGDGENDISIIYINQTDPKKLSWQWDGNKEAPTLSPSLRVPGYKTGDPDRWHGFMRNGQLVNA